MRNLSGYPTYQDLEVRAIKLLSRYDQCYMFINMSGPHFLQQLGDGP